MPRRIAPLATLLLLLPVDRASAAEAEAALSLGPQYTWFAGAAKVSVLDDQLVLGGGVTVVSDYRRARAGLRLHAGTEAERGGFAIGFGYAPRQQGRGWFELEPEAVFRHPLGPLAAEWTWRLGLRRADVATERADRPIEPVDQLALQCELSLSGGHDERLRLRMLGGVAVYDRDLSRAWFAAADLGPLVTLAGRPERYAVRMVGEVRAVGDVRLGLGIGGLAFATGGGALMTELAIVFGPLGGTTVGAAIAPLVPLDSPGPPRVTFRLEVGWER